MNNTNNTFAILDVMLALERSTATLRERARIGKKILALLKDEEHDIDVDNLLALLEDEEHDQEEKVIEGEKK